MRKLYVGRVTGVRTALGLALGSRTSACAQEPRILDKEAMACAGSSNPLAHPIAASRLGTNEYYGSGEL